MIPQRPLRLGAVRRSDGTALGFHHKASRRGASAIHHVRTSASASRLVRGLAGTSPSVAMTVVSVPSPSAWSHSLNRVWVTPNHRETSRRPQPNVSRSKSAAIIAGSRRLAGKCGSINRHWRADSSGTLAVARGPSFETRAGAHSSG
jgi:hypothetical protein